MADAFGTVGNRGTDETTYFTLVLSRIEGRNGPKARIPAKSADFLHTRWLRSTSLIFVKRESCSHVAQGSLLPLRLFGPMLRFIHSKSRKAKSAPCATSLHTRWRGFVSLIFVERERQNSPSVGHRMCSPRLIHALIWDAGRFRRYTAGANFDRRKVKGVARGSLSAPRLFCGGCDSVDQIQEPQGQKRALRYIGIDAFAHDETYACHHRTRPGGDPERHADQQCEFSGAAVKAM